MAYRLIAPSVGSDIVVYRTMPELLEDIRIMISEEESLNITIETVDMTSEQIDALPEFEGY